MFNSLHRKKLSCLAVAGTATSVSPATMWQGFFSRNVQTRSLSCKSRPNRARKKNKNMQNEPNLYHGLPARGSSLSVCNITSYVKSKPVGLHENRRKNEAKRTQNEPNFKITLINTSDYNIKSYGNLIAFSPMMAVNSLLFIRLELTKETKEFGNNPCRDAKNIEGLHTGGRLLGVLSLFRLNKLVYCLGLFLVLFRFRERLRVSDFSITESFDNIQYLGPGWKWSVIFSFVFVDCHQEFELLIIHMSFLCRFSHIGPSSAGTATTVKSQTSVNDTDSAVCTTSFFVVILFAHFFLRFFNSYLVNYGKAEQRTKTIVVIICCSGFLAFA
jgi:hypothetical protein